MAKINLLPWREELRQTQKKHYIVSLVGISVGVFILFWIAGQLVDQQIRNQNSRNNYLKQQIEVLDREIKQIKEITDAKDEISIRMALIEQLQVSRNLTPIILSIPLSIRACFLAAASSIFSFGKPLSIAFAIPPNSSISSINAQALSAISLVKYST